MGYIAGKMSKTGKAGWIGAQKIKFSTDLNASFEKGFKERGGKEVFTAWTNDWDDIAKGKEAALNQISQGADVIFPTMDNAVIGSLQAAKEKGVWGFGLYYDAIAGLARHGAAVGDLRHQGRDARLPRPWPRTGSSRARTTSYDLNTPEAARIGSFHTAVPEEVQKEVLASGRKDEDGRSSSPDRSGRRRLGTPSVVVNVLAARPMDHIVIDGSPSPSAPSGARRREPARQGGPSTPSWARTAPARRRS